MSRIFQHFEQPQMTTFTQQGAAFGGGGRGRTRGRHGSPNVYSNNRSNATNVSTTDNFLSAPPRVSEGAHSSRGRYYGSNHKYSQGNYGAPQGNQSDRENLKKGVCSKGGIGLTATLHRPSGVVLELLCEADNALN